MKMNRKAFLAVVAAVGAVGSQTTPANVIDWSSGATSTAWTATSNWVGGTAPANDITTDTARFDKTSYAFQPTAPSARSIAGIVIGDGATNTATLTLTTATATNRVRIGASGITMYANSGAATIGAATTQGLLLAANQNWTNNSSSLLTISSLGNANTGAYTVTLNGSGSGGVTISNVIGDGATAGNTTAIIINTTGGATTLAGSSTFTGGITLSGGTLNINLNGNSTTGPLGNGDRFTINGGTIDNTSGAARNLVNNNPITIGGSFAFSTSTGTTNNNLALPGAVSLAADRTITLNGAGVLSLTGTLTNTADSVRTLTVNKGSGTATSTALVIGGIALTGPGSTAARTDIINGNANVTVGGVSDGVSPGSVLNYQGTGVLTLNGSSSTGNILVSTGAAGLTVSGMTGAITVQSGVNATFSAAAAPTGLTLNSGSTATFATGVSFGSQGITVGNGVSISSQAPTLLASQTWTNNSGGVFTEIGNMAMGLPTGSTISLTLTGNSTASTFVLATVGTSVQPNGSLTISTGTTATISGANYTGGLNISDGATFKSNAQSSFGNGGLVSIGNNANLDNAAAGTQPVNSNGSPIAINGNFTYLGHLSDLTSIKGMDWGTGAVSLGAATGSSRTITVNQPGTVAGGTLIIGGVISNGTTANALIKEGAGTLTLSGASSFSGGLTVKNGSVNITDGGDATHSAIGTGTLTIGGNINIDCSLTSAVTVGTNNAIALNGDLNFLGSGRDLNLGTGAVTLGGTGSIRSINSATNAYALILGGAIGNGATASTLTKTGGGGLGLGGASNFTGGVNVNTGKLFINYGTAVDTTHSAVGTGPLVLGTVNGTDITLDNTRTDAAAVILGTANTITVNDNITFNATNDLNLGSGNVSLGGSTGGQRSFTFNANKTLTINGAISNGTDLTTPTTTIVKAGIPGTLALGGASSFSGGVAVNNGTLAINNGGDATHSAIGTGTLVLGNGNGGGVVTLDATAGDITLHTNNPQTWNAPTITFTGSNNLDLGNGAVSLGGPASTTATHTVTVTAKTLSVGGIANGTNVGVPAYSLVKAGSGTLAVNGISTYTGTTAIAGGTLKLGSAGALPAGNATLSGGTTLDFGASGTFNSNISVTSGTGTLTNSSAGLVTLGGTLTKLGTVLKFSSGSFNVTGKVTGNSGIFNSDLVVDGATVTFDSITGASDYYGPTIIQNSGKIIIGQDNILPSNTTVTVDSGSTLDIGSHTLTVASLNIDSTATLVGTGTISAPVTITGTISPAGAGVIGSMTAGSIGGTGTYDADLGISGNADVLHATSLDLSGLTLQIDALPGMSGSAFVIATYAPGQLTGEFASSNIGAVLPAGATIDYNYLAGNQVAVTIPEPSTIAMVLGFSGLLTVGRRRRETKA